MFVPGYNNGNAPYGEWVAETWGTSPDWATYNDFSYDFGVMLMLPNSQGQEIADVVGSRGIIFNEPDDQYFYAYGYPGRGAFDGERLWSCESPWLFNDPYSDDPNNPSMAIDCDMTEGSSGGGWVIGTTVETSYVNSVNSYSRPIYPDVMFGPYFGTAAEGLWTDVDAMSAAATPTPFPTPTESVDTHEMLLSLQLRRHLIAKGHMSAPDGYAPCTRAAPVGIFKKTSTGWRLLKVVETNDFGNYRARVNDRTGRYAAYSIDGYVDDLNYCTDSISYIRVHRH